MLRHRTAQAPRAKSPGARRRTIVVLCGMIALAGAAVLAVVVGPSHCSDYPDGHRCDAVGSGSAVVLVTVLVAAALGGIAVFAATRRMAVHR